MPMVRKDIKKLSSAIYRSGLKSFEYTRSAGLATLPESAHGVHVFHCPVSQSVVLNLAIFKYLHSVC